MTALSFCNFCGALLPPRGQFLRCDNCNASVEDRNDRLVGQFLETEAKRLCDLHGFEL